MWWQQVSSRNLNGPLTCLMPYNRKQNELSVSLNETFPSFQLSMFYWLYRHGQLQYLLSVIYIWLGFICFLCVFLVVRSHSGVVRVSCH